MDRNEMREGFIVGCLCGFILVGIVVMSILWFAS
jgi:hypothetical protein